MGEGMALNDGTCVCVCARAVSAWLLGRAAGNLWQPGDFDRTDSAGERRHLMAQLLRSTESLRAQRWRLATGAFSRPSCYAFASLALRSACKQDIDMRR